MRSEEEAVVEVMEVVCERIKTVRFFSTSSSVVRADPCCA